MMFKEFQDGCLVLGNLWYANGMILRSLPSSFCSRRYMVWKELVEEFQDGYLMLDSPWHLTGMNSTFLCTLSACCLQSSFLLKRIYGLEEKDVWRIPRWLFSARQSFICKWDDFSCFWVSMLHEAFHQVSAQEDIWFGRRYWLMNSKMAV